MSAECRYRLLIFDWDGTLADSQAPMVSGMQAAIADLKLPAREDRAIGELIGLGMVEGMRKLYPELDTEDLIRQLMDHRARAPRRNLSEAALFAGAQAALAELAQAGFGWAWRPVNRAPASIDRSGITPASRVFSPPRARPTKPRTNPIRAC